MTPFSEALTTLSFSAPRARWHLTLCPCPYFSEKTPLTRVSFDRDLSSEHFSQTASHPWRVLWCVTRAAAIQAAIGLHCPVSPRQLSTSRATPLHVDRTLPASPPAPTQSEAYF